MFYHDRRLQYTVRCDSPNPAFARMLQQAIGGIEGEMRVCFQYFFQAWNLPPSKARFRDMLLHTATEEIGHIEMLATAVAMNLEGAPTEVQEEAAKDSVVGQMLGGMLPRQFLSAGLGAMPIDAHGDAFTAAHVVASGNLAADMYANVMAESTGRLLATRLFQMTDDAGMKDMLRFLIARDTMHQNQWLAVLEELGGVEGIHPIPASFPQSEELSDRNLNYAFMGTAVTDLPPEGRWTTGDSVDGKGSFTTIERMEPMGQIPKLAEPPPATFNDNEPNPKTALGRAAQKLKNAL